MRKLHVARGTLRIAAEAREQQRADKLRSTVTNAPLTTRNTEIYLINLRN